MKPYTVILLYPDYLSHNYGQETYTAHVFAYNREDVIKNAQAQAVIENEMDTDEQGEDFYPLACFAGHIEEAA